MEVPHPRKPLARGARGLPTLILVLLACLLGLAGCKSLPVVVPDLATRLPQRPVQMEGARGPLTASQSKAVLDRLRASGQDSGIFARHLALEEAIVGSPLITGNKVRLLQDGPATYQAMLAAIESARDHVHMETYILDDDEVGQRFAQALIDRQRQGVQVHLIRDSVGTLNTPAAFFQRLSDAGVRVLEFNPVNPALARKEWELNERDHRKLLIVDGRIAFLGGINISGVYTSGSLGGGFSRGALHGEEAWRDTDVQIEGPVVAEFQKLFLATWAAQKGDPMAPGEHFPTPRKMGNDVVRAIGSSPEEPFSQIYATLLSAIGSAESSVYLTNAYFAPDPQLLAALEAAAGRGVDVRLILPSKTDSWLVFHAGRAHYERLLRAGVRLFERQGVVLHSKTGLIDGVWATVGSTNLDWRSFLHNHELNAVILGADFGAQVQAMFERDLAASQEITLAQWQRRPLDLRFLEGFSRLWEYWL
ncbi:cardiolipin synthase [Hydrogenophaga sp.]|uniref:cardiolipin synthase n=1 Tax=Hydrogenophaga sp. TaxID=1904254 RepID=UPI00262A645D|nr:cardiolipin synthase [Hydrogenophaga sp.]MCW5654244.1 cardiolipin synthase [Hydrogenophaga sp.]